MTVLGEGLETPSSSGYSGGPTRQVFERIRSARPQKLYVAADGPRKDVPGEEDLCHDVREIVTRIDWDGEFKTLFQESNQGCNTAISRGLSWLLLRMLRRGNQLVSREQEAWGCGTPVGWADMRCSTRLRLLKRGESTPMAWRS